MRITLLGTGDAVGTPKVGCCCPTCAAASGEGRSRLRTSILVEAEGKHILIDTSPDLRQQLLRSGSPHIDAVFWTHGHYDHYAGYGDFYRVQETPPVYGAAGVVEYCSSFFAFLSFEQHPLPPYRPFDLFGLRITPIPVNHPPVSCCGLLLEHDGASVGYTADTASELPERSLALLRGVDLLLLDAIVPPGIRIPKHMNYAEACSLAESLGAGDYRTVHMSHLVPWDLPRLGRDMECIRL
ncbi:MAG: MBL fold metallo-hydrolase [Methanomicrobiales archaeon]|nr:MBL fold metallo-hydrolase [Methanomicrobiales archaeon]MDI6875974.1 MBL fold metallo-hydrolase [Methanomicrobiales archaeon]